MDLALVSEVRGVPQLNKAVGRHTKLGATPEAPISNYIDGTTKES